MIKSALIFLLALVSVNALAESPAVYDKSVDQNLETVYKRVAKALGDNDFKVVFEVDIQENLVKFAAKNKVKDFNLNQLEAIKSMVFCNGALAVKISNADPTMLAMCPLHLTLTQKAGRASVLFVRPSIIAQGSKAEASAKELEEYNTAKGADKIARAKKIISELGEETAKDFESILDEEDEIEDGAEVKPNKKKLAVKKLFEKISDDDISSRYGKFAGLGTDYTNHLKIEALKKENIQVIEKSIAEIPKRLEIEIDGDKFGFDLSDEDFKEATEIIKQGATIKKALTPEEVKGTAETFFQAKHVKRMLKEVKDVAFAKGVDSEKRGKHGIAVVSENRGDGKAKTEGEILLEKLKNNNK